jgi:enoyl-CoA hydratase
MSDTSLSSEHIRFYLTACADGLIGCIELRRPKQHHAMSLSMLQAMRQQLELWQSDASVHAVLVQSEGVKAFCAGGDVVALYRMGRLDPLEATRFFVDEYGLNAFIKHFPKPLISVWDGMVMGGGVGISIYGSHRIATEHTRFAMPECSIGFFPDVGSLSWLPDLPKHAGFYLALTGQAVASDACMAWGLSTHAMASVDVPDFLAALKKQALAQHAHAVVDTLLHDFYHEVPVRSDVLLHADALDKAFSCGTLASVLAYLDQGSEVLQTCAQRMRRGAPLSVALTFHLLTQCSGVPLLERLQQDLNTAQHCLRGHDFYEGVRALLMDKDGAPSFKPARIEDVTQAQLSALLTMEGCWPLGIAFSGDPRGA